MSAAAAAVGRQRGRNSSCDRVMITPEGIALPITVGSRAARAGALIMDLVIVTLVQIATAILLLTLAGGSAAVIFSKAGSGESIGTAFEFFLVLWFIAMFLLRNAYFIFFELGPRGATPGKRMAGIRIAARDGGRLTAEMVIARNLLRDIELFLPITFVASAGEDASAAGLVAAAWFLVFALFPFFNRDRLRAGDIIAGTWVVEADRRKLQSAMTASTAAGGPQAARSTGYRFGEAELSIYGEYELQTLERVLRENRAASIEAVYQAICRKIGWMAGKGDERAFLEAFYTQLRERLETGMRLGERKADKFDS